MELPFELIDVPGQIDGLDHIFDRIKEAKEHAALLDWMGTQFTDIARDCAQNHGAVFEHYINGLIFNGREKVAKYVRNQIKLFVSAVSEETDANIARDAARNCGLIYAGGMIGIKARILPWTRQSSSMQYLSAIWLHANCCRMTVSRFGAAFRR